MSLRAWIGCAALSWAAAAQAHDTWLAPSAAGTLVLQTGDRFPQVESVPSADSVAQAGCSDAAGGRLSLPAQERAAAPHAWRVPVQGPFACWAELREFEVTLPPRLVDVYLREVRPAEALRTRWQALRADGIAWEERYRKFARTEAGTAAATPAHRRALRVPLGLDLEIVPEGDAPLVAGAPVAFTVLAAGRPVPGLSVELVGERGAIGLWSATDAQGRVTWPLPFGGAWLVRAVLLEPDGAHRWRSRFASFRFDAG